MPAAEWMTPRWQALFLRVIQTMKELAKKMNEYNEQRKFIEAQLTEKYKYRQVTRFLKKLLWLLMAMENTGIQSCRNCSRKTQFFAKTLPYPGKSENGEYRGSGRG